MNFAKKTSKATVNISNNADIYSAGNMDISATSTLNVAIETGTPAQGKSKKYIPATAVGGKTFTKILDGEYLKAGVAVGVISESNTANVQIAHANLTAKNDVAINAENGSVGIDSTSITGMVSYIGSPTNSVESQLNISGAGSAAINIDPTSYLDDSDKSKVNPNGGGNIVNVAFGSGAGSAGVSDIKNDGTINISNSNVTTDNDFLSSAQSTAHIINVAGESALSSDFASGLTFAYNAMNNTTGINVTGGNWNVKNFGANSINNNYALAVGAGVAVDTNSAGATFDMGYGLMRSNSTLNLTTNHYPLTTNSIGGIFGIGVGSTSNTTADIYVASGNYTVTKKDTNFTGKSSEEVFAQLLYNGITTATKDYPNDYLVKRYGEVEKLMGTYQGDVAAYSGLQQENITYNGQAVKNNAAINFVEVAKDITNPVGNVVINNNQGSIRINKGVTVNALDIEMTAKESISQGYTKGIVNIADTPEYSYADEAAKLRKTTGWDAKMPESNQNKTATSNWKYSGGTKAGNVLVEKLSSQNGGVTLKATGSIKQTIKGTAINARNIKLDSLNGAINLQIESGGQGANVSAISAAANGDIKLDKNDNADFLVGSIVSTTGDVTLTAKGKFVDALDKVRDNAENDQSELVNSWIDMGLIAGTSDYKGAYITRLEQDRDNYKSDVTEQFSEYKTLLASYQSKVDDYNALKTELDNSKPVESARLQELAKKFGDSKTVADDLAAEFEEYQILKSAYDGAVKSYEELKTRTEEAKPTQNDRLTLLNKKFANYNSADAYLAADKDYQTLVATVKNPVYTWTEGELLSGIRSAIVNKQEGTAYDVTRLKDANITGRNVTLTGTGVGSNSKEVTTIKMSELRVKANETDKEKSARLAKVSKLANVEAADVTVHYVTGKDGKPVVQTVTQVNYNYDADKGYYIDTAGNYVRYRKDADGNLLKYTYDKDLKQVGDAVAVNDFSDVIKDTTTIENKEIASFDISGTIPLGINATGNINIKTTGNDGVYIAGRNKGVKIDEATNPNNDVYSALNVAKIETAKADGNYGDVRIIGEKGIFNAATRGANVIGKDLVLVGGNGAIGTQAKPLTVTLTGDLLNARSNDEINLQKVGTDNFRISAVYSPKAIRIANDNNGIIEHSTRFDDIAAAYINSAGEITLSGNTGTADNPILIRPTATTTLNLLPTSYFILPNFYIKGLNTGTVNLNNISGRVDVSSEGSICQTATGANNATSLKVSATGDVKLTGNNKMRVIDVGAVGGTFALNNDSERLTANFGGKVSTAQITQTGDINLSGTFNGDVLSLTTTKGNIFSTGGLRAAKEINLSLANFEHVGEIHTDKLTIATDNGVTMKNTENTFNALEISSRSGNAVGDFMSVSSEGAIAQAADQSKVISVPSLTVSAANDITLTAGKDLTSGKGDVLKSGNNITLKADDVIGRDVADILIDAELKANESIWITTDDGDIELEHGNLYLNLAQRRA